MELAPHSFRDLAAIIHHESGMVLGPDKSYLVRHRLEPLLRQQELDSFDTLIKRLNLRNGSTLRSAVIDAITVKETRFFRDQACFDGLLEHVLPACAPSGSSGRRRIRFWSAAAATGQEAYSVAMLIREFIATHPGAPDAGQFSILATDISAAAIEAGRAARYTPTEVRRGLSEARLAQHCHQRGDHWHINETVRRMVQFRTFNLLHSPGEVGAFDLILCRNVLIYFDDATRRKICRALYSALHPGGWLALGSAESLYGMEDRFETHIHGRAILYQKTAKLKLLDQSEENELTAPVHRTIMHLHPTRESS